MKTNNLIGLTGGIGSGKSTIARGLSEMGYAVYDCDSMAKRIMEENIVVRSQIEYLFGSEVYQDDHYQPQLVAPQVFANPALLEKLNKVVHPAVCFDVEHWANRQTGWCFVESAILQESHLSEICRKIVCVTAPLETRIARTIARDHSTREKIEARIAAQKSINQMPETADIVVCNDGNTSVKELCEQIVKEIEQTE